MEIQDSRAQGDRGGVFGTQKDRWKVEALHFFPQFRGGDDELGIGILHLLGQLGNGVERIGSGSHGADRNDGQETNWVVDRVGS